MAEIPVITITGAQQKEPKEFFTRVFCLRKEPPPLSLLVDYLKARGATPIITADVNEKLLNSWILQFFEENCDGMVQIDGQGFYDPETGELIFELPPIDDEPQPEPAKPSQQPS